MALQDVDVQYVWRFLRKHNIDLAARKSWCESNDPEFAAKSADVVGPPDKAIVLCVDEKPSIQALERAQGYLKLEGRALTGQSHDYKRHGTQPCRTKLREAGLCPTRTRMALSALLFSKGDRHVTAEGRGLVHGGSAFFAARAYSSCSQQAISPPMTPPTIGATQNSQSDPSAALPPKMAVAVERAGFTDALSTGMATR